MDQIKESIVAKRKRQFLFIAPILILPFVGIFFWALGGGQKNDGGVDIKEKIGLNPKLPKAQLKVENWDKLKFYEQAQQDSAKRKEMASHDPYSLAKNMNNTVDSLGPNGNRFGFDPAPITKTNKQDNNEIKVYNKIAELNAALEKQDAPPASEAVKNKRIEYPSAGNHDESIDRLENMMQILKEDTGVDDDIRQLNGMVNNFIDLQNPDRMKERIRQESIKQQGTIYPVNFPIQENISVLGGNQSGKAGNGFFSDELEENKIQETALPCVIDEAQVVTNVSTIKIKVLREFIVNGITIPSGFTITGQVSFNSNRLIITVSSIIISNIFIPISLKAVASDGIEGLPVKGNIAAEVAKESADQAMQGFRMSTMTGSLGAEAVKAGIEATKSLVKQKTKQASISIGAGYSFFLIDQRNK
jgi:conjugative transposon TraM protein